MTPIWYGTRKNLNLIKYGILKYLYSQTTHNILEKIYTLRLFVWNEYEKIKLFSGLISKIKKLG